MIDPKELKSNLDLIEILTQRGVKLTKKGANFFARCPFHEEKTPSFSANPKTQLWFCFGCGEGGDVFTFVMKQEGIGFPEAVRKLCKRDIQAVDLEALNRTREVQQARAIDRCGPEVLDRVLAHWQERLAETAKAREYLERRGLWAAELLKAFRVGYASGNLPKLLPGDGKVRGQLMGMGLLNAKGNEAFYGRVVVPIFDGAGVLVGLYGRSLDPASTVPHLYLKGPHRGVFNLVGIHEAGEVILTESIIDAFSLVVLGFPHTTASYGVKGFTADHVAAFQGAKTTRVYCAYDTDPQGDHGAEQLAHDLAAHGIECRRVVLPCKDPNDFLTGGGTKEAFAKLLEAAKPMSVSMRSPAKATAAPGRAASAPAANEPVPEGCRAGPRVIRFGDRAYEVVATPATDALTLRVRLTVRCDGRPFIDTLNLYSDRARVSAIPRLGKVFGAGVTHEQIESDLLCMADELGAGFALAGKAGQEAATSDADSEADKVAAMAMLVAPELAQRIREDLTELGVVGEERSKLLVYLVATSRRLGRPLSLAVVSRSSAGKSFLTSKVSELMPPEDLLAYTRLSAKALFHDESERLKHKLITIEEAEGMEESAYALRVMQSSHQLRTLTTITDPTTGQHKAQETVVHGPVALIVTTTQDMDFETLSRAFVISADESAEQTERIHAVQRQGRTLDCLKRAVAREEIVARHRAAQRLLAKLAVVNAYAPQLTFPSGTLRLRREHEKYLSLIDAITYLFQHQREQGKVEHRGKALDYVQTAPQDIDLANELMVDSLRQAFDDITTPTRNLLAAIRKMVIERGGGGPLTEVRFCRREVREYTKWSDHPARDHLDKLERLELVRVVSGAQGREYVYALSPDHRLALPRSASLAEEIAELGLKGSSDLEDPAVYARESAA